MQVEYEIKASEHLEYLKAQYRSPRHIATSCFAALALLCGLGVYASADRLRLEMARTLSEWIIGLSLFTIMLELLRPYIVHWRVYGRNRRLFGTRKVTFREEGIIADNPNGHVESEWNRFEGFRETKTLFLIYLTADVASIIPRRSFPSQVELDEFRSLLARKLRRL